MDTDIYRAPEAELQTDADALQQEFYVVSKRKFLVLFFATFSIYSVYWFYRHWSQYKRASGESMMPVMRAIFSIFFTHALFRTIQSRIEESGKSHKWSPALMATIYVVAAIVGSIADRIAASSEQFSAVDLIGLATFPVTAWVLYAAQKAANIACGDPEGEENANFTAPNFLWIVLGVLFWIFFGIGIYDLLVGLPV
ncbi:DUF4234 domain-containing protein [Microbulbifer marinus]|uniref:DUF4234 domain-containing protein n=1 Tax=Microbulbifer marinus TaxID=658218 RepID=A0A1H3YUG6_9GAMM|nr:DUF4234 domain-containing protein [Microbulbifer marinus]SEA14841.1 protein of unknown function [Microbulbifer marinus]